MSSVLDRVRIVALAWAVRDGFGASGGLGFVPDAVAGGGGLAGILLLFRCSS